MKKVTETRVNLSGVVVYKEHTTKNEQGVAVTSLVPETDPATGNFVTEDANRIIESSKAYKEIFERHAKNGWPEPTITKHQTFEYTEVEQLSEVIPYFTSLGLDAAVAEKKGADIFQRGWAIAQQQEVYSFMNASDQPEVEGTYSVAAEAAQPGERRQKDPLAAAVANLKKAGLSISVDDLKNFMAQMASQNAPVAQ